MYSRARIAGHPLHPMLISLPITSFIWALATIIVFFIVGSTFWLSASYWLAIVGVVAGLVAALPGFVDWLNIPGSTQAKAPATVHMLLKLRT